jgi:hypothetical protein
MEMLGRILAAPFGVIFILGSPLTYIISVVDTWSTKTPVLFKILTNLTIDAFLALIWPITWALWAVMHLMGQDTPLSTVFGF